MSFPQTASLPSMTHSLFSFWCLFQQFYDPFVFQKQFHLFLILRTIGSFYTYSRCKELSFSVFSSLEIIMIFESPTTYEAKQTPFGIPLASRKLSLATG